MRVRPAVSIRAFLRHLVLVAVLAVVGTAESRAQAALSMEQLDALTAPIALYPDTLLAQVMIASTYPAEVAQAAQWAQQNSSLQGTALDSALQQQPWDASVKALVQTPSVLQQMSSKLDWTQQLGDAVLAQQTDVMDSVQRLRQRAQSAGNLMTTQQQTVVTQPPAVAGGQQTIVIEQADPQVLYVPSYDTQVVYGGWPYPSYPPTYWPPPVGYGYPGYGYPGYAFGTGLMWGAGVAIGAAAWGNAFDWGGGDINVNANRNNFNNFNSNNFNGGNRVNALNNNNRQNWQHNSADRRGSNYRDTATREKFGKTNTNAANARRESRGFDQGQRGNQGQLGQGNRPNQGQLTQQLGQRGGQGQLGQGQRPNQGQLSQQLGQRGGQGQLGQGQRPNQGQLSQQLGQRGGQGQLGQNRSATERRGQVSSFDGANNGARARQASARGSSSRQMMAQNSGRGGGAGVNRGGGGGGARATGGGGGRGGGGGGRGGGGGGGRR